MNFAPDLAKRQEIQLTKGRLYPLHPGGGGSNFQSVTWPVMWMETQYYTFKHVYLKDMMTENISSKGEKNKDFFSVIIDVIDVFCLLPN